MTPSPKPHDELSQLAETSGWAHGLAMRLVGDVHLAEDIVQEAMLASLERPDAAVSRSAWFAGAIKNLALQKVRKRSRSARRDREASREEALPAASDSAARLEQQEILIGCLLALDEPFRGTLIARYVDGLAPRKIAEREGTPIATVNSRLARGLERLREQLTLRHGGDKTRWMAAMAPLLQPPPVMKGPVFLGALLMKKSIVACLFLLLVPFAWYLSGQSQAVELPALVGEQSEVLVLAPQSPSPAEELPVVVALPERAEVPDEPEVVATVTDEDLAGTAFRSVLLVDDFAREPLDGAEVWLLPQSTIFRDYTPSKGLEVMRNMPNGLRELCMQSGRRYVTDAEGRVDLPVLEEPSQLYARHGDLHCLGEPFVENADSVIVLAQDRAIRVRVVDDLGKAVAGVPVGLVNQSAEFSYNLAQALTQGSAECEPYAELLHWQSSFTDSPSMAVALDFPLAEAVSVPIRPSEWPEGDVVLQLPAVGSVLLRVKSADRNVRLKGLMSSLARTLEGAPAWAAGSGVLRAVLEDSDLRFWPVGVGVQLTASVWPEDAMQPEELVFDGPLVQGEQREVTLTLGGRTLTLTGRILNPDGSPYQKKKLFADLGDGWMTVIVEASEDGVIELEVIETENRKLAGPVTFLTSPPEQQMVSSAPVASSPSDNAVDLGTLRLQLPVPIVDDGALAGRVVDLAGTPIPDVTVQWVKPLEGETGDGTWRNTGRAYGRTAKDGTFHIPDFFEDEDDTLQAVGHGSLFHSPLALEQLGRGTDGELLLVMQPGAQLTGKVSFDAGVKPEAIEVSIWNQAAGAAPRSTDIYGWIRTAPRPDGVFRFDAVAPGRYTLLAGTGARHDNMALVEDLDLYLGENSPAAVNPIEMKGLFRTLDLVVVNEQGASVIANLYGFRQGQRDGKQVSLGPESLGNTRTHPIQIGSAPLDALILNKNGYFPVLVDPVNPPSKVVMVRGLQVTTRWGGPVAITDLPGKVEFQMIPADAPEPANRAEQYLRIWSPGRASFSEQGHADSRVRKPGMYQLLLSISYEYKPGYYLERAVELGTPLLFRVRKDGEEIQLDIPEAPLNATVAWIRERFDADVRAGQIPPDLQFGETAER